MSVKNGLNDRQELFCNEYVKDMNASQAYIRAGYAAKNANVAGPRLLSNVRIKSRINALKAERSKRCMIDSDYVLNLLKQNAEICMGQKRITITDMETRDDVSILKHEPGAANKAAEILAKHLGLLENKHTVNVETLPSLNITVTSEEDDDNE